MADYLCEQVLVKFLVARDWDIERALAMVLAALQWRIRRPCHRWSLTAMIPSEIQRAERLKESAATGKIRVTGTDKHGMLSTKFASRETLQPFDD